MHVCPVFFGTPSGTPSGSERLLPKKQPQHRGVGGALLEARRLHSRGVLLGSLADALASMRHVFLVCLFVCPEEAPRRKANPVRWSWWRTAMHTDRPESCRAFAFALKNGKAFYRMRCFPACLVSYLALGELREGVLIEPPCHSTRT